MFIQTRRFMIFMVIVALTVSACSITPKRAADALAKRFDLPHDADKDREYQQDFSALCTLPADTPERDRACTFTAYREMAQHHLIAIDRHGNYYPIRHDAYSNTHAGLEQEQRLLTAYKQGTEAFADACRARRFRYQPHLQNIIDQMEREYRRTKELKGEDVEFEVMLYVHGGLNTLSTTFKKAVHTRARIERFNRANTARHIYPIFVSWRSGAITTYWEHLSTFRQGEEVEPGASWPIYLLTDLGNSVINTPKSWYVEARQGFGGDVGNTEHPLVLTLSNGQQILSAAEHCPDCAPAGALLSFVRPITIPITYTMARPAWDIMLRRTQTMFRKPRESMVLEEDNSLRAPPVCDPLDDPTMGNGAMSVLLSGLADFAHTRQDEEYRFTLTGHSMGVIIANQALRTLSRYEAMGPANNPLRGLEFQRIVHMAGADTIENLLDDTVPYLARHADTRFYNLSLHPRNEDLEVGAMGAIPSGSLLVYIDDMYTTPHTDLGRTSGRWTNLRTIMRLLPSRLSKQMHFKIFSASGCCDNCSKELYAVQPWEDKPAPFQRCYQQCQPIMHGDFNQFDFWQPDFYWQESNNVIK